VAILRTFVIEMAEILPAVFILAGLIDVWVPRRAIERSLGAASGWKGPVVALLIGSSFAGPIYAAFPLVRTFLDKGATVTNATIILCAWAVLKAPMLLVEAKFLGLGFMYTRYAATLPCIFVIALLTGRLVTGREVDRRPLAAPTNNPVESLLPGRNCGACGYATCSEFAMAVVSGESDGGRCLHCSEGRIKEIRNVLEGQATPR
jgi:uncharacterized membrane protein YraQ (UPF0718 family)